MSSRAPVFYGASLSRWCFGSWGRPYSTFICIRLPRVDLGAGQSGRSFPGPGRLHPISRRSTRHCSWNRKSGTNTKSTRGREVQRVPSRRGRRAGGHPWRMGLLGYGIFWWFLGPMTLMPLWQGRSLDWSYQHGQELSGSLVGHIVYGLIVGVIYATADRLWVALFIESDPINRQPEPLGSRTVRSIGWGAVAGLLGGLVFLPIITLATGPSQLAGLVGGTSPVVGGIVHLCFSLAYCLESFRGTSRKVKSFSFERQKIWHAQHRAGCLIVPYSVLNPCDTFRRAAGSHPQPSRRHRLPLKSWSSSGSSEPTSVGIGLGWGVGVGDPSGLPVSSLSKSSASWICCPAGVACSSSGNSS